MELKDLKGEHEAASDVLEQPNKDYQVLGVAAVTWRIELELCCVNGAVLALESIVF
jgi:hypothetical protein